MCISMLVAISSVCGNFVEWKESSLYICKVSCKRFSNSISSLFATTVTFHPDLEKFQLHLVRLLYDWIQISHKYFLQQLSRLLFLKYCNYLFLHILFLLIFTVVITSSGMGLSPLSVIFFHSSCTAGSGLSNLHLWLSAFLITSTFCCVIFLQSHI